MKPADQIESVAIIGNGLMGQGIAQVFARAGKRVMIDRAQAASLGEGDGLSYEATSMPSSSVA